MLRTLLVQVPFIRRDCLGIQPRCAFEFIVLLLFLAEGYTSLPGRPAFARLFAFTADSSPSPLLLLPSLLALPQSGLYLHFSMEPTLPGAPITGVAGPPRSSGTILIYSCRPAVTILRALFSFSQVSCFGQSTLGPGGCQVPWETPVLGWAAASSTCAVGRPSPAELGPPPPGPPRSWFSSCLGGPCTGSSAVPPLSWAPRFPALPH